MVSSYFLLFCLLFMKNDFLHICQAQQQRFDVNPNRNFTVNEGTQLEIPCVIRNRRGECHWLKHGAILSNLPRKYEFERTPNNGDCSLHIYNITYLDDDSTYQCQVSNTVLREAPLTSNTIKVDVLVQPEEPVIENIKPRTNNQAQFNDKQVHRFDCKVNKGNPPPIIKWQLGNRDVTNMSDTTTYRAKTNQLIYTQSILQISFTKADNGAKLSCISLHPLLNTSDSFTVNITYIPEVTLDRNVITVIENGDVNVECKIDANPPATAIWKLVNKADKSNRIQSTINGNLLYIKQMRRELNGTTYQCQALNYRGPSNTALVVINVLYSPHFLTISPSRQLRLGSNVELICEVDGNPTPMVSWYHFNYRTAKKNRIMANVVPPVNKLELKNISYLYEGDYFCEARNVLYKEYIVESARINIDVIGQPSFIYVNRIIEGEQGRDSLISVPFCADPLPNEAFWIFGSIRLPIKTRVAENESRKFYEDHFQNRFIVYALQKLRMEKQYNTADNCFDATLRIKDTDLSDQREYTLQVRNDKGIAEVQVRLIVVAPLSGAIIAAITFAIILILCIAACLIYLNFKRSRHEETINDDESKEDVQALSQASKSNSSTSSDNEEKTPVKENGTTNSIVVPISQNNHVNNHTTNNINHRQELVYANLDFPPKPKEKPPLKPKPPPIRPKPQLRPSQLHHARNLNSNSATEYAKLAFPNKADL